MGYLFVKAAAASRLRRDIRLMVSSPRSWKEILGFNVKDHVDIDDALVVSLDLFVVLRWPMKGTTLRAVLAW